jgi:hypothetical protein
MTLDDLVWQPDRMLRATFSAYNIVSAATGTSTTGVPSFARYDRSWTVTSHAGTGRVVGCTSSRTGHGRIGRSFKATTIHGSSGRHSPS